MLCNFDIIFSKTINNEEVNYGIIEGNNTVLFIKAGQDGSMYGYQNKYLTIANNINKNYGYTVICSSNPLRKSNPLEQAIKVIEDYCQKREFEDYKIYLENLQIDVIAARIISVEDYNNVGCTATTCTTAPSWFYSTSYWTGISWFMQQPFIVGVSSANKTELGRYPFKYYGVRPVIEVLKTDIDY